MSLKSKKIFPVIKSLFVGSVLSMGLVACLGTSNPVNGGSGSGPVAGNSQAGSSVGSSSTTSTTPVLNDKFTPFNGFRAVGYAPNYSKHPQAETVMVDGDVPVKTVPKEVLKHLTHVMFFSMALKGHHPGTDSKKGQQGELDLDNFGVYKMKAMRNNAHAVGAKFILVIGGYAIGTAEFAAMANNSSARINFAKQIKNYVVANDIDGVDIDWEFPNAASGYENFRLMIEELKKELHPHNKSVSIAINPDLMKDMSSAFLNSADFVNVMTYDLTGQDHAPLSAKDKMTALVARGAKKNQLTYGVPFYGRNQGGYGGKAAIYSALYASGSMANSANSVNYQGLTYYYNGPTRIAEKTKWAKDNGYGGIMIWDINQDVAFSSGASLMRAIAQANGSL
jgi:chitinase